MQTLNTIVNPDANPKTKCNYHQMFVSPEQLKQKPFKEIFKKQQENLIPRKGSQTQMKRKRNPPHPQKSHSKILSLTHLVKMKKYQNLHKAFQTHNIVNETIHDEENSLQAEDDASEENSVYEIESHLVNGEQDNAQEDKLLTTSFEVKVEN